MGAPKRPRQGEKIVKATWVDQAVALAIKGWSTRRIAAKVRRHHSTVADALNGEFERIRPSEADVHRLRGVMGEQLDVQIAAWAPRSIKGDKDAAIALVRFQDRKSKLFGLDAPTRNEHTGADGAPIVIDTTGMSIDDVARLLAATEPGAEGDAAGAAETGPGEEDRGGEAGT